MRSVSTQDITETGDAYWRGRVFTLESLVVELLMKNQAMRFALQAAPADKFASEVSRQD
ncbi:hypothetical protein BH10ACI4_BH10ACI4_18750 [soil metagenome]